MHKPCLQLPWYVYYKPCIKCTILHKSTCNNVLFKMLTKELMYIMSMPGGLLEPLQQCDTKSMPYPQWLQQWLSHLIPTSLFSKTPLQASHIHTPLIHAAWLHHLRHHPHQDQVQYFLQCISTGFRVRFDGSCTQSAKNNLQSTVAYPTVVDDYIHHEQDKW